MLTVKEIAKMCGVSPSTVSNILNGKPNVGEETKRKVLEIIQETGYHTNYFASSMRRQNSRVISLVCEDLSQFTTPPIVESIMAYCEEREYRTILVNMRLYDRWQDTWFDDEEKVSSVLQPILREIESIRVVGNIYVAGHGREIKSFPKDYSIPTVVAYAMSEKERFPSVLIDDENGGYDMGRHLIEMGHRRIAVITGVENNMHSKKRLVGFQKALFEAGIPFNPEWIFHGNWNINSGYALAGEALKTNPTVIWCMNDQMAGGVYRYLHEHNLEVGRDVSVAGFDYMDASTYMLPQLTTDELPLKEIGKESAEILIHMIEDREWTPDRNKIWIPCTMRYGASVRDIGNTME